MRLTYWNDRKGSFDWLCDNNEIANKLAAYEDTMFEPEEIKLNMDGLDEYHKAEAEGRLVVLPCKVGDTVYRITKSGAILDELVDDIVMPEFYTRTQDGLRGLDAMWNEFGKTVFLTREEAEAALKSKDK